GPAGGGPGRGRPRPGDGGRVALAGGGRPAARGPARSDPAAVREAGMTSRRAGRLLLDAALAYLLFWGSHTAYRTSTGIVQLCDSAYSLVVAQKWLTERTLDLSACVPADPDLRRAMPGYIPESDMPYHFVRYRDPRHPDRPLAVYYGYPLGSTVLSVPWVRHYVRDRGLSLLGPEGLPNKHA